MECRPRCQVFWPLIGQFRQNLVRYLISFDQSLARNTDSEVAKSGSTADLDNTFFILIEFFFFCVSCVRSTFHDASTNK